MRRDVVAALALLALGWAATLWIAPFKDDFVTDIPVYGRFAERVFDGGFPYRGAFFEYPPLAAPVILVPALFGTGYEELRVSFAIWMLLASGGMVALCGLLAERTGGDRLLAMLAAALMPLLLGAMVRTHFDVVPIVCVLGALALVGAGRVPLGFAVLGLGAMTKGFPIVVAPVLLAWLVARGRGREALHGAVALTGVIAVLAIAALTASWDGATGAVTYHTGRPVQVESVPATIIAGLDAVGLGEERGLESHASNGIDHPASDAITALLTGVLIGVLALLATLAARREGDQARRLVLASLAAVLAFTVFGKVLSPQYMIWLIPLGALALAWGERALAATVGAAAVLTQLWFPSRYFDLVERDTLPVLLVAARNVLLVVALALCVRALVRSPAREAARSTSPGRPPTRPAPRSATGRPEPSRSGPA
jgi:glycosyl transferase family 87